jgi:colicin import membrane protein
MMAQAGGSTGTGPATSTGTAAQSAAPTAAYSGRLVALIRGNLVFTGTSPDNNAAEVEVSAAANGNIISRRLVKSSGHKDWDDAVLRAIDRTATLPRDVDGRVPSRLIINFRPRE